MTKNYQERLNSVIPGGAHTYSRGMDQFPANAPAILERGDGAYVWDTENRKYLDYGMALRAVTLGYAHPEVNAAAIRAIDMGNNLTRASTIELAAAERLVDLIPSVDMVKFAKNGSNATTAAVKIARAYTRRRYICIPRQHPFFSFDDWFIGTTAMTRGIPQDHVASTLVFDYGDITSLRNLFAAHPNEIAGVMLEPATHLVPCGVMCPNDLTADPPCGSCPSRSANFLVQVQELCRAEGALFILDEMITGFRWHVGGAQAYFGVTPDLCTFGKGMANGFSVAAVAGRKDVMSVGSINRSGEERTFLLSTTHGGEMCGLAAFLETMKIYVEHDVCRHLWGYGARLREVLREAAADVGMTEYFVVEGPAICLVYVIRGYDGQPSLPMRTLFSQEMVRHGVLMPWVAVSLAHGDAELALTGNAVRKALKVCRAALDEGVEHYLEGPAIKPVFRQYN